MKNRQYHCQKKTNRQYDCQKKKNREYDCQIRTKRQTMVHETLDNWRLNNTNLAKNRGELRNGMFTMGKLKSSHWNYILVYNKTSTVHPVICEGWYFTHTWKAFALRGEVWVHKTSLTLLFFIVCTKPGKWLVMSLCVIVIHFVSFHDFEIVSTVWYFCFSFYYHKLRSQPVFSVKF